VRRAIDIHEGEDIDADAFATLLRAAIALNGAQPVKAAAKKAASKSAPKKKSPSKAAAAGKKPARKKKSMR
jgi:hypothetical protein